MDRQFALWQGLHPDEYYQGDAQAMLPFRTNEKGDAHTPFTVQDTNALGYAYPELQTWLPKYQTNGVFDKNKLKADLETTVNKLYNSTRTSQQKAETSKTAPKPSGSMKDIKDTPRTVAPKIRAQIHGAPAKTGLEPIALNRPVPEVLKTHDYVINILFER